MLRTVLQINEQTKVWRCGLVVGRVCMLTAWVRMERSRGEACRWGVGMHRWRGNARTPPSPQTTFVMCPNTVPADPSLDSFTGMDVSLRPCTGSPRFPAPGFPNLRFTPYAYGMRCTTTTMSLPSTT